MCNLHRSIQPVGIASRELTSKRPRRDAQAPKIIGFKGSVLIYSTAQ